MNSDHQEPLDILQAPWQPNAVWVAEHDSQQRPLAELVVRQSVLQHLISASQGWQSGRVHHSWNGLMPARADRHWNDWQPLVQDPLRHAGRPHAHRGLLLVSLTASELLPRVVLSCPASSTCKRMGMACTGKTHCTRTWSSMCRPIGGRTLPVMLVTSMRFSPSKQMLLGLSRRSLGSVQDQNAAFLKGKGCSLLMFCMLAGSLRHSQPADVAQLAAAGSIVQYHVTQRLSQHVWNTPLLMSVASTALDTCCMGR